MLDMGFAEDLETILVGDPGRPPDGALLGHDLARRSQASPSATCTTRSGSRSTRDAIGAGDGAAASARSRTSCGGRTSSPRCAASSTWRTRPRRWSSAGPAARSTISPKRSAPAATTRRRSTAAWPRRAATGSWAASATVRWTSSSRPMSRHADSTSSTSRTSSTTTSRRTPTRTCTGSAGPAGPAGRASRSRSSSRASTGCCATSRRRPGQARDRPIPDRRRPARTAHGDPARQPARGARSATASTDSGASSSR